MRIDGQCSMERGIALVLALLMLAGTGRAEKRIHRDDFTTPQPFPERTLIVIGFLGAWEDWDNPKRSVRKLVLRLREMNLPGVFAESAGNHSRKLVREFILSGLDRDRNGKVDASEAAAAQIILYGQSFGGAAAVKLSRELERDSIPVRLTVQVDSVGHDDDEIPANVHRAANLFQRDPPGPVMGRAEIRAKDPTKTQILFNQRFTYLFREVDMSDYPPISRKLGVAHFKMDNDPLVWGEVEGLILSEIARWQAETQGPRPSR
jgi:hypothetical protein